ncbi:MAG: hypothetical protein JSR17_08545 [Proteobacteria bacterium]|nr:hypothetical protein [Pseudomonadota bacterium]
MSSEGPKIQKSRKNVDPMLTLLKVIDFLNNHNKRTTLDIIKKALKLLNFNHKDYTIEDRIFFGLKTNNFKKDAFGCFWLTEEMKKNNYSSLLTTEEKNRLKKYITDKQNEQHSCSFLIHKDRYRQKPSMMDLAFLDNPLPCVQKINRRKSCTKLAEQHGEIQRARLLM